jgi:glycosyltransferase involved in cell wall biosynthesis
VPRVTVIIATYNWSSVLPYSIGSALRQTLTDFEVLVVGDGCIDDSAEVVAAIGDPRVRWINLPRNTGHQSGPNNEGLRQARGDVIAYLGHDDLWLPHHLQVLVEAVDRGADVVSGILLRVAADGVSRDPVFLSPRLYGDGMPPTALAHRRAVTERVGGWADYRTLTVVPEFDLFLRARKAGYVFASVPRLTAIKFPASTRRDVYRTRPCQEQAAWLARIDAEPDLEAVELASIVTESRWPFSMRYSELVRAFARETLSRFRRRVSNPAPQKPRELIEAARRVKGL